MRSVSAWAFFSRETWRWKSRASFAASCMIFFSSGESLSQKLLLTITTCGLYWWRVIVRYFCTSSNFITGIVTSGFLAVDRLLLQRA